MSKIEELKLFIKECIAKDKRLLLFLDRKGENINYGIMSDYFDVKIKNSGIIGSIEMTTEDDFYNIYAYLKDEYFSSFSTEIIYISGYGRMMVPAVSDKVSIQIRSDSLSDMNWINEEVYNVKNNNGKTI